MLEFSGRWLLRRLHDIVQPLALIRRSFRGLPELLRHRRPEHAVLLRQLYFTGFEALPIILRVSLIIGTVIIIRIMGLVGAESAALSAKILVWTVVRELGPLLTAMIVIARSGSAMAAEIGAMKVAGEIQTLEILGIPVHRYLVLPRLLAAMLSVFVLTIYFDFGAVLGGLLVAALGWNLPWQQFLEGLYAALTIREIAATCLKSLIFGLVISASCCHQGLSVGRSSTMIPQAATRGVIGSVFAVFFCDGVIELLISL